MLILLGVIHRIWEGKRRVSRGILGRWRCRNNSRNKSRRRYRYWGWSWSKSRSWSRHWRRSRGRS